MPDAGRNFSAGVRENMSMSDSDGDASTDEPYRMLKPSNPAKEADVIIVLRSSVLLKRRIALSPILKAAIL